MKLNAQQLALMREAGIKIPAGVTDDSFMTADDDQKLADYLIDSLGPNQEMTDKAEEVHSLLNYLASDD